MRWPKSGAGGRHLFSGEDAGDRRKLGIELKTVSSGDRCSRKPRSIFFAAHRGPERPQGPLEALENCMPQATKPGHCLSLSCAGGTRRARASRGCRQVLPRSKFTQSCLDSCVGSISVATGEIGRHTQHDLSPQGSLRARRRGRCGDGRLARFAAFAQAPSPSQQQAQQRRLLPRRRLPL